MRLNRRAWLSTLATAGLGTFAGCTAARAPSDDGESSTESSTAVDAASTATPASSTPHDGSLASSGYPPSICETEPDPDVGIRAVVDPAYGPDWDAVAVPEPYRLGAEVGPGLTPESYVIGVENAGNARAYPMSVVWWHEVVNDVLPPGEGDGAFAASLLVTYCPICQSGMVAERLVAGDPTTFGVTGQLWQPPRIYTEASKLDGRTFGASATEGEAEVRNSGNLVLFDETTRSYWSQLLARAICGPQDGTRLTIVPSTVTTWADWRAAHPETDVLLPPPHSGLL